MANNDAEGDQDMTKRPGIAGAPGAVVVAEDPAAPSEEVSSKRQSLSDLFTIVRIYPVRRIENPSDTLTVQFCSGFALISDGYQNNLMYSAKGLRPTYISLT